MHKTRLKMLAFLLLLALPMACNTMSKKDLEDGFSHRSELIIRHTADYYNPPPMNIGDPEKYYWPKAMARFEVYGLDDSLANDYIDKLSNRSPFHFTLLGMARLLSKYDDAPAIRKHKITILERVFEREDAHNAWTSEGTENHIVMERSSGYIFAMHAADYPDRFPDAKEKMTKMKEWISIFSKRLYQYGTGEWNSSTYQAYHINAWLNLFDFARDQQVREMAKAVLDYYAAEMALHFSWGSYGGSQKRGKGANEINTSASNYLSWLWFGAHINNEEFLNAGKEYIQCMHAITSEYRPPSTLKQLAGKNIANAQFYKGNKPSYLYGEKNFVKQFFYTEKDYTLGSSVSPYGGWTGSTSQIVNWQLIIKPPWKGEFPIEITGNGGYHERWNGSMADPFTQLAQHKNVLIQATLTPENHMEIAKQIKNLTRDWSKKWQKDFKKRFPGDEKNNPVNMTGNITGENLSYINLPENVHSDTVSNLLIIQTNNTTIFLEPLYQSEESNPYVPAPQKQRKIIINKAPHGILCGFIIEVIPTDRYNSLNELMQLWKQKPQTSVMGSTVLYHNLDGDTLEFQFNEKGRFTEALYDWGYGETRQQVLPSSPPFKQPDWPSGRGFGKIAGFKVNGNNIFEHHPSAVYSGPFFSLENSVLRIINNNAIYKVDYSGKVPVFSR